MVAAAPSCNALVWFVMSGHKPVLLSETIALLASNAGGRYLDATFGGGGHTTALLEHGSALHVTAIDCDPEAIARARVLEDRFPSRFRVVDANFRHLARALPGSRFDGILFDFGVSSFQLDDAARGFSFGRPGPTDMRLDPRAGSSAALFLETAPEERLVEAVRDFGEERHWRRVVGAIVAARGTGRLSDTRSLADVVAGAIPARDRATSRIHPATRTFQGLRIAVNDELGAIDAALPAAFELLEPGGVLAAIAFHSLEDRRVKRAFRRLAGMPESEDDHRPADLRERRAELLTRRGVRPSEGEVALNPRARSATLRAVRRLPAP